MDRFLENLMPAYKICYLDQCGQLARTLFVRFESEIRAKVLAHAMKPADCRQFEVWKGKTLIYRRPEQVSAFNFGAI